MITAKQLQVWINEVANADTLDPYYQGKAAGELGVYILWRDHLERNDDLLETIRQRDVRIQELIEQMKEQLQPSSRARNP